MHNKRSTMYESALQMYFYLYVNRILYHEIHFHSNLIFGSSNIISLARDCNSHTFCMKASSEHNNMSLLHALNMIMKQLSQT